MKNHDQELAKALYSVLFGIETEWDLTPEVFASLLHVSEKTYIEWKNSKEVELNSEGAYRRVLDFIDFYDTVSSFFASVSDQVGFLNAPGSTFNYNSPFELIKENFQNIHVVNCYFTRFRN